MRSYLDLAERVLNTGETVKQRATLASTGEKPDCRSLFGEQIKVSLRGGFPLLTTKQMPWKAVLHELVWFLRGETNVQYLKDNKVKIWDEWADDNGELGSVYGWQWRNFGGKQQAAYRSPPKLRDGVEPTVLGVANGSSPDGCPHWLKKRWEAMIQRCYDRSCKSFPRYGGRGVAVCDRWLELKAFAGDAASLPGWENGVVEEGLQLDKDGLGNGFLYSPETCQWISRKKNVSYCTSREYTVEHVETGEVYSFSNAQDFCKETGAEAKNLSDLWTGTKNAAVRSGFRLVSFKDHSVGVDQIANLEADIKAVVADPWNSAARRMLISAWNPGNMPKQKAPIGCHTLAQFSVRPASDDRATGPPGQKRRSCHLYMR